jgi:O-methyltransferase
MTDITLQGLSARQLAYLGDAALTAGDAHVAKGFYQRLVRAAPSPQAHSRLGLTLRPNARTSAMLGLIQSLEAAMPGAAVFVGEGIATWLKNPVFAADQRFLDLAAKDIEIAPKGISNWHWNLQTVLWAAQQARELPGDYVELGVYKGHTTKFLADYLDFESWPKRWWLFDTFEGIPADQLDPGREGLTVAAYGAAFSFEEVRDRFAGTANITVVQGRVPEVFAQTCPDAISFLHIDLNNATAEVGALDALYDRLVPGGVIVFDDFGWSSSHAQAQAELAWFRARGLAIFPLPTGQGLFVKPPA